MIFNYLTTNKINGKKYIGSHSGSVGDNYLGSGNLIKKAIKKYGKENFVRDVLNAVTTREEAFKNEKFLIEMYKTSVLDGGYNLSLTGGFWIEGECIPWNKGKIGCFSKETLKKMSESHIGQKSWSKGLTKDTSKGLMKISKSLEGRACWSKGLTKETSKGLAIISEKMMNRVISKETRKRMGESETGEKNWNYGNRGEGTPMYGKKHSEESRAKMSKARKGRFGEKSNKSKPLLQYTTDGVFVKEWVNGAEVHRKLNIPSSSTSNCANRKKNTAGGFIWRFRGKTGDIEIVTQEVKKLIKERIIRGHPNGKPILQYSLGGKFIKEWGSAVIAARVLNLNSAAIRHCVYEEIKTSGDYIWKFKD